MTKDGIGDLTLSGNNAAFTGPLSVVFGTLFLNGAYGGSVSVSDGAHIVYNGPISGDLNITNGTITTLDVNTLFVGGNYTQAPGTIYIANVNSLGQSSLINMAGTASIAGSVQVDASRGVLPHAIYRILHADGGVSGTYGLINPYPLLHVLITYDANNVYLSFATNFVDGAMTPNEKKVAAQLDQFIPATTDEADVINNLLLLPPSQLSEALNVLSGEQYSNLILTNLYDSNRFNRQIFNSIRTNLNPCSRCVGIQNWGSGGGGQAFQKGNQANPGFNLQTFDFSTGMHACLGESWLLGGALAYNSDTAYSTIHANSLLQTGTAAVYSSFQKDWGYLVLDLMGARTWTNVRRHIQFGEIDRTARSSPGLAYGRFDLQGGADLGNCDYNLKPYVAGSAEVYHQQAVQEHGAGSLNLSTQSATKWLGSTQLGLHTSVTAKQSLSIDVDLAWQHYYGNLRVDETVRFQDFGTPFLIQGPKRGHDGLLAALYFITPEVNAWSIYLGAEGEVWRHWYSYEVNGGFGYRW